MQGGRVPRVTRKGVAEDARLPQHSQGVIMEPYFLAEWMDIAQTGSNLIENDPGLNSITTPAFGPRERDTNSVNTQEDPG
ncbi:hypothetical protein CDAR_578811 [Caerostris darwini]|uniref:Uncharacterized protein n=1 Tax=Caerostris darwini TaxID=1538125 RepID=A0AAV4UBX7_9ARAC|nr:hypothetical protein CDAR_578811 [Caerostris darwini]